MSAFVTPVLMTGPCRAVGPMLIRRHIVSAFLNPLPIQDPSRAAGLMLKTVAKLHPSDAFKRLFPRQAVFASSTGGLATIGADSQETTETTVLEAQGNVATMPWDA